uniref:Uncharacterized protein n=1 Tax=Anguilla anguilla TaxID=7936 RepID=A0A0E9QBY9_ANGAN
MEASVFLLRHCIHVQFPPTCVQYLLSLALIQL